MNEPRAENDPVAPGPGPHDAPDDSQTPPSTTSSPPPPPRQDPPGDGRTTGGVPFASRYGLVRPSEGRHFAGVCAALGQATRTDPLLWRVLLSVLVLFGGIGLVAYLLCWILIPEEGDSASPLEAMLGRGRSTTSPTAVVVIGAVCLITLLITMASNSETGIVGLAVIVGAAIWLARRDPQNVPPVPSATPQGAPSHAEAESDGTEVLREPSATSTVVLDKGGAGASSWPPLTPHGPFVTESHTTPTKPLGPMGRQRPTTPTQQWTAPPPRRRSVLGRMVLSTMCLVLGIIVTIDLMGVNVPGPVYFASALGVVTVGLFVGTWRGSARWLVFPGLVLCLGLAGAQSEDGNMGSMQYEPYTVGGIQSAYQADKADITLDLSNVDFTGRDVEIELSARMGNITVIVPPDVDVDSVSSVKFGSVSVFGERWEGLNDIEHTGQDLGDDGEGGGHLTLDIDVRFGSVEVSR